MEKLYVSFDQVKFEDAIASLYGVRDTSTNGGLLNKILSVEYEVFVKVAEDGWGKLDVLESFSSFKKDEDEGVVLFVNEDELNTYILDELTNELDPDVEQYKTDILEKVSQRGERYLREGAEVHLKCIDEKWIRSRLAEFEGGV